MAIKITTSILDKDHHHTITTMRAIMQNEPAITPRSHRQLIKLLRSGNIALAYHKDQLIGWVVAQPLPNNSQELAMGYTLPEYRKQGVLKSLLATLVDNTPTNIAVTFQPAIAKLLYTTFTFRDASFAEVMRATRGGFLLSRLSSFTTIRRVASHVSNKKPIYLIRNNSSVWTTK